MYFLLSRYLSIQLIKTTCAVSMIILLIVVGGRFINYLTQVALGSLKISFVFFIMMCRFPEFLSMILPLSFMIAIILTYGRMCIEHEMVVLYACGVSRDSLLVITMLSASVIMMFVAILSVYMSPQGIKQVEKTLQKQLALTEFETLIPGRFQQVGASGRVTYAAELTRDKHQIKQVFIVQSDGGGSFKNSVRLLVAEKAQIYSSAGREKKLLPSRFLVLNHGSRYDINYYSKLQREVLFDTYALRLPEPSIQKKVLREQALPLKTLWKMQSLEARAEVQWRLSLPLMIPFVVLVGIPLSHVNPRQGRFLKLIPGVALYLLYLVLIIYCRDIVEQGSFASAWGLWSVHLIMLGISLLIYYSKPIGRILVAKGKFK